MRFLRSSATVDAMSRARLYILELVLVGFAIAGCNRIAQGPRITSYSHLYQIGLAIRDFRDRRGALPSHLSELVPDFISSNQMAVFYVPEKFTEQRIVPSDWESNPSQIGQYSAYTYLGTNGQNGIIAFERTNLWETTVDNPDKVAVLFDDFHVQDVAIVELRQQIHQQ
jgi:hypothetical protein